MWFRKDGKVAHKDIAPNYRPREKQASIPLPDCDEEFDILCSHLAAEMAFVERDTHSPNAVNGSAYVRCYFEPILVGEGGRHTSFYPSVKVHANGVCIFSLRIFGPDWPVESDLVLAQDIALSHRYFDQILLTPGLLGAAPVEDILQAIAEIDASVLESVEAGELARRLFGNRVQIEEEAETREYIAIDAQELGGYAMLEFVWSILEGTLDAVALRPPKLSLEAHRASREYERPWFSHPAVYILQWPGQPYGVQKLGAIEHVIAQYMTQSLHLPKAMIPTVLKPMPRLHDDYRSFVNEAISVYAFGTRKLEEAFPEDTYYQRLTPAVQVAEEMALWVVGSYRSLERRSKATTTVDGLRKLEREKRDLDSIRERISHYGELEEFYSEYFSRFALHRSDQRIDAELGATETDLKDAANVRIARFGIVLALVFGLIGSGQVADSVVTPLRKSGTRLPVLFPNVETKLSDYLLAIVLVLTLVGLTLSATNLFEWIRTRRR